MFKIFACGDVRFSPVKRVASAVGEGAMSVAVDVRDREAIRAAAAMLGDGDIDASLEPPAKRAGSRGRTDPIIVPAHGGVVTGIDGAVKELAGRMSRVVLRLRRDATNAA